MSKSFRQPFTLFTNEIPPFLIKKKNTVLLIQDFHNYFSNTKEGVLFKISDELYLNQELEEYKKLLLITKKNIIEILKGVRNFNNINILYTCLGYFENEKLSIFLKTLGWNLLLEKENLFEKKIKPHQNDLIFSKGYWSALTNLSFVKSLKNNKIENVIICGNILEYGIINTTFDLMNMGIKTLIVSDAVTSLTYQANNFTKGSIAHGLIKLRSTGETLELINNINANNQVKL